MAGKLIVVEGMDGTGKTTLINKLIPALNESFPGLNLTYQKPVPSSGPEGQTGQFMIDWMNERFKEIRGITVDPDRPLGQNQIYDRINLISEPIYGPICRGYSRLDQVPNHYVIHTDCVSKFLGLNPIIIFCRPLFGAVIKNLDADPDVQMDGVKNNSVKLYDAYDKFFEQWRQAGVDYFTYDYMADPEAVGVIEYIKDKLKK